MDEGRAGIALEARVTIGAVIGAALAALIAPVIRPLFHVPTGGVGFVTLRHYPKGWDYAVVALLVLGSFAGGLIASQWRASAPAGRTQSDRRPAIFISIVIFILTFLIQDRPNAPLDFFHEGEHLTPAFLLRSGERPYRDVFFHHGLAADGALEALFLGDPLSVPASRRLEAILGAATLALIPLIAAEVCATTGGVIFATLASLCAIGVGVLRMFPYFRLAPVLLAALGLLCYLRTQKTSALAMAMCASTLGMLWSIDTGMFALAGTLALFIVIRVGPTLSRPRPAGVPAVRVAIVAILLPLIVLWIVRADIRQFFVDSFVIIPRAADAIGSLPAPDPPRLRDFVFWLADEPARYYVPLVVYGFLLALSWRLRDMRIAVLTPFALLMFRSAAGRADFDHIRFALPLFGILVVAFIIEPLALRRRFVATIVVSLLFIIVLDVVPNVTGAARELWTWPARQIEASYTTPETAVDLAALNRYVSSFGRDATFFDFSNERALYFLLRRKPPVRCPDVMMLSAPPLLGEAMAQLRARPPSCVVLEGYVDPFDGIPSSERVPEIARWIDANYPMRMRFGRFLVATRY